MAARKPPRNGRPWTPEKVRERIRISMIVSRLQRQALGQLEGFDLIKRPVVTRGKQAKDRQGNPKFELIVRSKAMSRAELASSIALLDRCIPKAQAPLDIALNGNITVIRRDPTQRPAGYHRKGKASP